MPARNVTERHPLGPFDVLMYRSENDPRSRSTVMGLQIVDRSPDWETLVENYERISRLLWSMRQRVVEPPVPIAMPMWVLDPNFELSYHLRRARLPAPGTQRQLLEFLEPLTMTPLDHARPLWEFWLIEGLEDGSSAWFSKMSHAIADGVSGQELAKLSADTERHPPAREMPPVPVADDFTPNDLLREALRRLPGSAASVAGRQAQTAARAYGRLLRRPGRTVSDAVEYARSLGRVARGPSVEPSPLLRGRSLRRHLTLMEIGLDELKQACAAADGSLNDGLLAAVGGALRRYHEHFGRPVDALPIAIPIDIRTAADTSEGNRWAPARLALPVSEPDVAERIRLIRELVLDARRERAIAAMDLVAPIAARLPATLLASGLGSSTARHDVQVSNVRGGSVPRYFAGAKITKTFAIGPVPGCAAMITLHSYLLTCFLSVNLDPAAITDPELFERCLQEGVDEVLALRPPRERTTRARTRTRAVTAATAPRERRTRRP